MPEDAVLDAPVDVEPVSDAPEPTSSPSEPAETPEPTSETPDPATPPEQAQPESRFLNEQEKALLAEIQAKNPAFYGRIRRDLALVGQFRQAFPGGLKEAHGLRQTIKESGGVEGIKSLNEEKKEWYEIDEEFGRSDPKFIDRLATRSPEAFSKLLPVFLEKFSQTNPYDHGAHVTQIVLNDMDRHKVPLMMERLQDFIGDNPRAMGQWKQISDYFGRLQELSSKSDKENAPKEPDEIVKQRQALDQDRTTFTREQWNTAATTDFKRVFESELAKQAQGRDVSEQLRGAIWQGVMTKCSAKWQADATLQSQLQKLFANKDRSGFDRIIASRNKQDVPEILRQEIRILPAKPGPKPKPIPQAIAKVPIGTGDEGFIRVGSSPGANEIDYKYTNNALYAQGKAVLKSGKKVQWK